MISKLIENLKFANFSFTISLNDKNKYIFDVNEHFVTTTGYSREEIIGQNCRFLQGSLTNKTHIENIRTSCNNHNMTFQDILNYTKKGETFINRLIIVPLNYDNKRYLIGFQNIIKYVQLENLENQIFLSLGEINLKIADINHYIKNPLQIIISEFKINQPEKTLQGLKRIRDFILNINDESAFPKIY